MHEPREKKKKKEKQKKKGTPIRRRKKKKKGFSSMISFEVFSVTESCPSPAEKRDNPEGCRLRKKNTSPVYKGSFRRRFLPKRTSVALRRLRELKEGGGDLASCRDVAVRGRGSAYSNGKDLVLRLTRKDGGLTKKKTHVLSFAGKKGSR